MTKGSDRNRALALLLIEDIRADIDAGDVDTAVASLDQLKTQVRGSICTHCSYFGETRDDRTGMTVRVPAGWTG